MDGLGSGGRRRRRSVKNPPHIRGRSCLQAWMLCSSKRATGRSEYWYGCCAGGCDHCFPGSASDTDIMPTRRGVYVQCETRIGSSKAAGAALATATIVRAPSCRCLHRFFRLKPHLLIPKRPGDARVPHVCMICHGRNSVTHLRGSHVRDKNLEPQL